MSNDTTLTWIYTRFGDKQAEALLDLACHAALPVALDSKLLHLIRLNFFHSHLLLDYTAEAEFLLSPLCREIGADLYELLPEARTELLKRLYYSFPARITKLSRLIGHYTKTCPAWMQLETLRKSQLLTALLHLDNNRAAELIDLHHSQAQGQEQHEWLLAMRQEISLGEEAMSAATPDNFVIHKLAEAKSWRDRPEFDALKTWWREHKKGLCLLQGGSETGKTALMGRFVRILSNVEMVVEKLPAPSALFVFSFYESPDINEFFERYAAWLHQPRLSHDELLALPSQGLLVLDGLDKMQDSGEWRGKPGQITDSRLAELLRHIADHERPGTSAIVASRYNLPFEDYRHIVLKNNAFSIRSNIYILKGLTNVPESLNSEETNEKRRQIIAEGRSLRTRNLYTAFDIKDMLLATYNGKCCYCEQDVSHTPFAVCHYRPQSIYYWLVFSWDNLLLCCNSCNTSLRDHFKIMGERVILNNNDLNNIHQLTLQYNDSEQPMLIHPGLENFTSKLSFDKNGKVFSSDMRAQYTIDVCKIDRSSSNNKRKQILDDFLRSYEAMCLKYVKTRDKNHLERIVNLLKDFSKYGTREYSTFRKYVAEHFEDFLGLNEQEIPPLLKKYEPSLIRSIRWLHLSDFHIGKDAYGQAQIFEYILEHVRTKNRYLDFIFITGDIAFSGQADQYQTFQKEFVTPMKQLVGSAVWLMVPGTHDVDRQQVKWVDWSGMLKNRNQVFEPTEGGLSERQPLLKGFEHYNHILKYPDSWLPSHKGYFTWQRVYHGVKLGVVGVNTAWLSKDDGDKEQLTPGKHMLEEGLQNIHDCQIKIVLGHHAIDWWIESDQASIKALFRKYSVLYLHGHIHQSGINLDPEFLTLQAGAAFQDHDNNLCKNRILWGEIHLNDNLVEVTPYSWEEKHQEWIVDAKVYHPRYQREGFNGWVFQLPVKIDLPIETFANARPINSGETMSISDDELSSIVHRQIAERMKVDKDITEQQILEEVLAALDKAENN